MTGRPDVSVVVPTRNGAGRLPTLFEALRRQTADRGSFEVLVVDDGSDDDTPAVVEASGIATLLTAGGHLGRGAATNVGVRRARGRIIAFTDDDTIPAGDWLARGIEAMDAGEFELLGGRIDLILNGEPSTAALVDIGRNYLDQSAMVEEGYAATANLWALKETVESVGAFREGSSVSDHDRDFVERAVAAGGRLGYASAVVVQHPPRETIRDLARKEFRLAYGAARLRRYSVGPVRGRPQVWTRPRLYVPWRNRESMALLERRGYRLRGLRRLKLRAAQYLCLQLVQAAGSLVGTVHAGGRGN